MIQTLSTGIRTVVGSIGPSEERQPSPMSFILEEFFAGQAVAEARFIAINGVNRRFRIDINGKWAQDTLTLHEKFNFDDGETDEKTWRFTKTAENTYMAHREDVVRPVRAVISSNTLRYSYLLYLDPANSANVVRFRDKIQMVGERTLKNTAIVTKFGIPVALVTGTFTKLA